MFNYVSISAPILLKINTTVKSHKN